MDLFSRYHSTNSSSKTGPIQSKHREIIYALVLYHEKIRTYKKRLSLVCTTYNTITLRKSHCTGIDHLDHWLLTLTFYLTIYEVWLLKYDKIFRVCSREREREREREYKTWNLKTPDFFPKYRRYWHPSFTQNISTYMLHLHHNWTDLAKLIDWIPKYYTIGLY